MQGTGTAQDIHTLAPFPPGMPFFQGGALGLDGVVDDATGPPGEVHGNQRILRYASHRRSKRREVRLPLLGHIVALIQHYPVFEQPEGGHPASPALLVLRTQHFQFLAVAPHFAGLDAELVVCGGVVKFSACDDGEDVTVLQV